jgi:hypothetical protein
MSDMILSPGPPPLTQFAADAALDAIDFIAAAVRGVDTIDVTDVVRPLWRTHLATWYPHLPPMTRQWYANAPMMLATVRAQWPLMPPWQQAAILQQWSIELPQMLWMLDPVLAQAQTVEMQRQSILANLAAMREEASRQQGTSLPSDVQAVEQLNNHAVMTEMFRNYSTSMANSTINLMRSINYK